MSYGLFSGIAVKPLCPGVPALNNPVGAFTDNGIVGRFDDGRKEGRGIFRSLPVSNIPEHAKQAGNRSTLVPYRRFDGMDDAPGFSVEVLLVKLGCDAGL